MLLISLVPVMGQGRGLDKTRQPEQSGTDVLLAVIDQLRQSGIFGADPFFFQFLSRVSYVATEDGMSTTTYQPGANNALGFWQVSIKIKILYLL